MSRPQKYNNERLRSYLNKNKKKPDNNNNTENTKDKNITNNSSYNNFQATPTTIMNYQAPLNLKVERSTANSDVSFSTENSLEIRIAPPPTFGVETSYKFSEVENNPTGQDQVTHL